MNKSLNYAWVGLGSNQGDSLNILRQACIDLSTIIAQDLQQSPIYLTQPWGYTDQPIFFNQVVTFNTHFTAMELLKILFKIEEKHARQRTLLWGPRTLDLDLLDYQDVICQENSLILPHPRLHLRRFVLQPWCDLAPLHYLKSYQASIQELLQCCPDTSQITQLPSSSYGSED